MKSSEEYKTKFLSISTTEEFVKLINEIQTEAWNEAIQSVKDMSESSGYIEVHESEVEKLKK